MVDAAMVDGVALLMAPFFMALRTGYFTDERGTNLLDSGAPFYDSYVCADGRYVAVGALERQFYAALLDGSRASTPSSSATSTTRPAGPRCGSGSPPCSVTRSRDEWVAHFAGRDACVAPVNTTEETLADPHLVARGTVVEIEGVPQPAPAPRFSGTPARLDRPAPEAGEHTDEILGELGYAPAAVADLRSSGAVSAPA